MENKIRLNKVSKEFQNFKLGELSFSIPKGYVIGFIGKNGAGKTTTIRSILSLVRVCGEILIDEKPVTDLSYLQDFGIVMDEPFLGKDWTMGIVNEAMKTGYKNWDEKSFWEYLQKFSIQNNMKVGQLSRGMKIKLMLSIAFSHKANVLILDEPTSGLDPQMRDEFVELIQDFMEDENHTVLFSTHITQDLEAIADYIVYIDSGQIVDSCSRDEFIDSYRILRGDPDAAKDLMGILKQDGERVLGVKETAVGTEILVRKSDLEKIPENEFVVETPTIEKIMMLYGRVK